MTLATPFEMHVENLVVDLSNAFLLLLCKLNLLDKVVVQHSRLTNWSILHYARILRHRLGLLDSHLNLSLNIFLHLSEVVD